jgi:hypothetical protein
MTKLFHPSPALGGLYYLTLRPRSNSQMEASLSLCCLLMTMAALIARRVALKMAAQAW